MSTGLTICRHCNQTVRRTVTENGNIQPVEPAPDPAGGRIAAYLDGSGTWRSHQLLAGEQPAAHERVFRYHVCPNPPAAAKLRPVAKSGLPEGVADFQAARLRRRLRQTRGR